MIDMLKELRRLIRSTRDLVSSSPLPTDGAAMAVMITTFIIAGKNNGMSKEQMLTALSNVWDNFEES